MQRKLWQAWPGACVPNPAEDAMKPSTAAHRLVHLFSVLLAILGPVSVVTMGCTVGQKKAATNTALDAMSKHDRLEMFEAMARVLDEQPELVDEMYAVVRKHDPTMNRFLDHTTSDLADEGLARRTAARLTSKPASLEQMLVQTTDTASPRPDARAAMNRAISARAEIMTDILTDDSKVLGRMIDASVKTLSKKPAARQSILSALHGHRGTVLAYVKRDKRLAKEMTAELIKEAVEDKPTLDKILRRLDIIEGP
jgi:hypothetical protein